MHLSGCCHYGEVAIVERLKQEWMHGLFTGTQRSGHCEEVAIVESWPLAEV